MRWDARRRVYVDERGRVVPAAQVREWVEDYIEAEKEEIESKASEVLAGTLLATAFFSWLRRELSAMHGAAALIAYGGEDEMTPGRWARVGDKLASEYQYLDKFVREVADVKPDRIAELWSGVGARAQMYADASYGTYENSVKAREGDNGVLFGRRVAENDGATCDDCTLFATGEWQSLDDIPDIGDSQCMSNCRCTIEFQYANVGPLTIDREIYAVV